MDFRPGDVLRVGWDERPIRVMMADHVEVFYDALLQGIGWNLAPARTASYYRAATSFLQSTGEPLRSEPLTDDELASHRPDLPLRMLRSREAQWNMPAADWPTIETAFDIKCQRIALIPFGPKGAPKKPVIVDAANGLWFAGDELLAAAQQAQTTDCPDVKGVGLYRSGISRGTPSYYLWGAVDKSGHADWQHQADNRSK